MKTAALWFFRLGLAAVLAFAAVAKLRDPAAFAGDIENFQLIPAGPSALLAVYLPWLELLLAAGLLLPRWQAAAALLAAVLFAVFTTALGLAWLRGLDIRCGCFGHENTWPVQWAVARNVILLAASITVFRSAKA